MCGRRRCGGDVLLVAVGQQERSVLALVLHGADRPRAAGLQHQGAGPGSALEEAFRTSLCQVVPQVSGGLGEAMGLVRGSMGLVRGSLGLEGLWVW